MAQEQKKAEKAEKAANNQFRAMADYKNHYFMTRLSSSIAQSQQPKPKTLIGATITEETYDVQDNVGPEPEEEDIFAALDNQSQFEDMIRTRN